MHKISAWKTDEKERRERKTKTRRKTKRRRNEKRNEKRKDEKKLNGYKVKTTILTDEIEQCRWLRAPNLRSRKPKRTSKKKKIPNPPANNASTRDEHFVPIQISRSARFPFQGQNAKGAVVLYTGRSWHRDALFFIRPQCAVEEQARKKARPKEDESRKKKNRRRKKKKRRTEEKKNRRTEERKRTQTETVTTTTTTTTTISTTGQLRLLAHPSQLN